MRQVVVVYEGLSAREGVGVVVVANLEGCYFAGWRFYLDGQHVVVRDTVDFKMWSGGGWMERARNKILLINRHQFVERERGECANKQIINGNAIY